MHLFLQCVYFCMNLQLIRLFAGVVALLTGKPQIACLGWCIFLSFPHYRASQKNFLSEFAQNCPNCPDLHRTAQKSPKLHRIAQNTQNCPKYPELSKITRIAQISVAETFWKQVFFGTPCMHFQECPQMACLRGCIVTLVSSVWLLFHCVFSNTSSNCLDQWMHNHTGRIRLVFLHYVFICVLKWLAWEDAYPHWLHLFDFSSVCPW